MTERRDGATVMLYTKEGKVLLQHRSEDAPRKPGIWSAFGGGMEEGELPEQTARRELMEELEYEITQPHLLATEDFTDMLGTGYNFIEEYDSGQSLVLHEGQGYGWFTFAEALELPISEYRYRMICRLREYLERH